MFLSSNLVSELVQNFKNDSIKIFLKADIDDEIKFVIESRDTYQNSI